MLKVVFSVVEHHHRYSSLTTKHSRRYCLLKKILSSCMQCKLVPASVWRQPRRQLSVSYADPRTCGQLVPTSGWRQPRRQLSVSYDDPRMAAYSARTRRELAALDARLVDSPASCSAADRRRRRHLADVVQLLDQLDQVADERRQLDQLLADSELRELAEQEAARLSQTAEQLQEAVISQLVVPPTEDACDVVLEVTAGVGGQEARLFASELLDMYLQYGARQRWRVELATRDGGSDLGGVRYAAATVRGPDVFARLKHEGGVHRVQRVPRTERSGRLHTSTVAVAVLPLPEHIEVHLPAAHLKMETKRAGGAGGQHVNTTDSAVRLVHLPTGLAVECQETRSQHTNRQRALEVLRARLYQLERDRADQQRSSSRKLQVGSSGRSEKIRTYNFPQDRVTDHRAGVSLYGVQSVLSGQRLDEIIDRLRRDELHRRLLHELDGPTHTHS